MSDAPAMEWDRLLCAERLNDDSYHPQKNRSIFVQDNDRIVFSASFRRLANKTQVQPLYEHDHVHHRLIHSIEVSSVGRSLAIRIGHWLAEQNIIEWAQVHDLADIVQAACVAHDIGNPPFGHSGEDAIGAWFSEQFSKSQGLMAQLPGNLRSQFTAFEGNAQGFRILTRLEMYRARGGMRLSKATLGAFTKYPVTAADRNVLTLDAAGDSTAIGLKKFGIFNADLPQFLDVSQALGLPKTVKGQAVAWGRHPLVFLMEAADDITYNVVDIEDAFTTGELSYGEARRLLEGVAGMPNQTAAGMTQSEEIAYLRARSIGSGIDACAAAFIQHYDAIMRGGFTKDLISASTLGDVFADIRKVARNSIYSAPRKTELEISGRRIISNVMSGILPVYEELARCAWDPRRLSSHSNQLVSALSLDFRDIADAESALHGLADYVSGMTDRYALRVSRMLSGI